MVVMDSIGRYRLVRRIGAGSFATVWLGNDDDLDVPVAVKVLADNWASNDDVRNRFLTEARIMRGSMIAVWFRVRHRHPMTGRPYFVMDYIDGGSLNDCACRASTRCAHCGSAPRRAGRWMCSTRTTSSTVT